MRRNPLPGVALLVLGVAVGCAISPVASAAAGEVSQLIATLKTGTPDAREHAAERLACGYCGYTDEAVSALVALLADGDDQQRADAAYALTLIDDGGRFTPHLNALLGAFNNDAYWRVRANLAYVLAAMPDSSQVFTALRDALHDSDAHVRAAGVYNLEAVAGAQKANAKIVPDLLSALSDVERTVRYAAATGLAKIGSTDRHTVDVLAGRLGVEPDPWVRGALAGALGAAGEAAAPALPALIKAIVDPYPLYVAEPATRAIARMGPVGIPALVAALGYDMLGDGRVVAAAVDGLAQMPGPLADRLGGDLKNGPEAVRSGIAQVLGRRAQEAAVAIPLLKGALDDPEPAVRADAAQALAKLADK
ncbi:MAG TPA: HEAT repeat domain-containing protein, partial [Limnochordia bacterium]|nr:HEAT repeat domain-containing protein [Limnochordia bacterium]